MMKAPTKRAMNPNTRRKVLKNPSACWNSAACSSAADWAVCALALSGRTSPMRVVRSAASVPGAASTPAPVTLPSWPSTAWAVGRSKKARVAPPRLSASPNDMIPARVKSVTGIAWLTIGTVSPTA